MMIYPVNSNSSRIYSSLTNNVVDELLIGLVKLLEQKSSTEIEPLLSKLVSKDPEVWRRLLDDSSNVLIQYFYSKHSNFFSILDDLRKGTITDDKVKSALTMANSFALDIKKFKNTSTGQIESLSKLLA